MKTIPALTKKMAEDWNQEERKLPKGKTCGDCVKRNECPTLFGPNSTATVCQYTPSQFQHK